MTQKELIVVGGPNGSGKTTFAKEYVEGRGCVYVAADEIALELNPGDPTAARFEAGRVFVKRFADLVEGDQSIVIESTLSGRTLEQKFETARAAGFEVTTLFLFLGSADTCVDRVRERVQNGGHDVPEDDVRRRFGRCIHNFWHLYRPLSHNWTLLYNSGAQPEDVAVGTPGEVSIRNRDLYEHFHSLLIQDAH